MDDSRNRYWPFSVLPLEQQNDQHREEIGFLEDAYEAGYKPYMWGSDNFGATAGERIGEIVFRGRKHWEIFLIQSAQRIVSAHVNCFGGAADALLGWLRGADEEDIIENLRAHLLITLATGAGLIVNRNGGPWIQ